MANKLKKELETEGNYISRMDFMDNPNIKLQVSNLAEKNKKNFSVIMRKLVRRGLEFYLKN